MWSLPTRERELKRFEIMIKGGGAGSLPTRERELKLDDAVEGLFVVVSLPTRERELKRVRRPRPPRRASRSLHGSVN